MLDVLKRLFITDSPESTGKRDLLQESQDSKSMIDRKLYSEVEPYIDYIFEKVSNKIVEQAKQGYCYCTTSFASFRHYDNTDMFVSMVTEQDIAINNLNYDHYKLIKNILLDRLSLLYSENIEVSIDSDYNYLGKSVYVFTRWDDKEVEADNILYDYFKRWVISDKNKDSLKEITDNAVYNSFNGILYKVNKDIQRYVADGENYSITSFNTSKDHIPYIKSRYYEEIKKYLEKELANIYKGSFSIKVFSSIFDSDFLVTVDWKKKQQKKGLF